MRAVVYRGYGAMPEMADVADAGLPGRRRGHQRRRRTGVCRSDWHAWKGHDPVALPHIPGHD